MLIYNEKYQFGIMWDVCLVVDTWIYGYVNIIIGGEIFPKKFANNITLITVFDNLKLSFEKKYYDVEGSDDIELGDRKVNYHRLDYGKEPNIFKIETSELGDKFGEKCSANCLHLKMGYSKNEERLFFSEDFGETYREIRMLRGTVEGVVKQLPTFEKLRRIGVRDNDNSILLWDDIEK